MSKVELQNITKIYDKTIKALDDISFTVNDGEFFVLLGPTSACLLYTSDAADE